MVAAAVGLVASRSTGQEAQAATRSPSQGDAAQPGSPSLLDALSFSSKRDPISVSADQLEFDYRTHVLTYKGGVEVTQGDVKLLSDTLRVVLEEHADNSVKDIVADGNVRVTKGPRWATGGRAEFDQAKQTVVLSNDAVVHDGSNEVRGDRIVVYLRENRSVVEGGTGRVRAVLYPPKSSETAAAGSTP
ncbi:MAG TPA: lipopolysaccharide transport periplasmic protein LptA [Candidatus Margulisiibacteriota bacterium]|nr:lipopolysaccharide transport periplasmic protein LptA [Candidatus Margulisiibacteriota bacterium]